MSCELLGVRVSVTNNRAVDAQFKGLFYGGNQTYGQNQTMQLLAETWVRSKGLAAPCLR